jgi:hypothetical protein
MECSDLVTVYTVANPLEAEVIKNALNAEGIRCFVAGGHQAGEVGLTAFEIDIQVAAEDSDRATKFIRSHERGVKRR